MLTLQHHKWYKVMILKLEQASESSGGLVKRQTAEPYFLEFQFQFGVDSENFYF